LLVSNASIAGKTAVAKFIGPRYNADEPRSAMLPSPERPMAVPRRGFSNRDRRRDLMTRDRRADGPGLRPRRFTVFTTKILECRVGQGTLNPSPSPPGPVHTADMSIPRRIRYGPMATIIGAWLAQSPSHQAHRTPASPKPEPAMSGNGASGRFRLLGDVLPAEMVLKSSSCQPRPNLPTIQIKSANWNCCGGSMKRKCLRVAILARSGDCMQ
jgi:hypothetical protein